jgi:hypothetical protein
LTWEKKEFSAGLSFVAKSRVKILKGLAFQTHFPWSCIQQPEETPTAKALREDNEHHSHLDFELDTFGMDLSQYVFFNYIMY